MQETNGYPDKRPDGPEGRWERDVLRDVLLAAYKEQRRARFWRNFWRIIGVLLIAALWFGSDDGTAGQGLAAGKEHTAVITLEGEIGGGMDDQVKMLRDSMEAAYSNPNAKGIVIRANSPGGSPVISNTAFNEIRRLKSEHKNIPVYVVAEDMCASGCYYIAAAADKIYANPSSIVGSIGVIGGDFDVTGLMEKLGIKRRLKTAGSNKGMGDPFTPETPEQGKIWEGILSDTHQEFIKAVKLGRGEKLKDKEYPDVFSGRVYVGLEAKKVGLIDDFGSVYSIARDVVKAPELVSYMPEDDFRKILSRRFGAQVKAEVEKTLSKMW